MKNSLTFTCKVTRMHVSIFTLFFGRSELLDGGEGV